MNYRVLVEAIDSVPDTERGYVRWLVVHSRDDDRIYVLKDGAEVYRGQPGDKHIPPFLPFGVYAIYEGTEDGLHDLER